MFRGPASVMHGTILRPLSKLIWAAKVCVDYKCSVRNSHSYSADLDQTT
jgi:hypothetical protein